MLRFIWWLLGSSVPRALTPEKGSRTLSRLFPEVRGVRTLLLCCILAVPTGASSDDDDVYGESATRLVPAPAPASEDVVEEEYRLPDYPDKATAIEVSLGLREFPFSLYIDPDSIRVDDHRDVRYSIILESASGATNVAYEAVRCTTRQYRRHAYGSAGQFKILPEPAWRYVSSAGGRRYVDALMREYLCPLPARNAVDVLIGRLKRRASVHQFSGTQD
jgi:hypothetical protein